MRRHILSRTLRSSYEKFPNIVQPTPGNPFEDVTRRKLAEEMGVRPATMVKVGDPDDPEMNSLSVLISPE